MGSSSPIFGVNIKKYLKPPPSCVQYPLSKDLISSFRNPHPSDPIPTCSKKSNCTMPSSRSASWWYETKFKQGRIRGYTGVILLQTQTIHYYKGNSSKLPYFGIVWFPPNGQFNDACYTTPLWKVSSDPYWPQWDGTMVFRRLLTSSPHFSLKFIWHHSVLAQKDTAMMKHWRYIHFNKHGKNNSFLSRNYLKWSIFLTDMFILTGVYAPLFFVSWEREGWEISYLRSGFSWNNLGEQILPFFKTSMIWRLLNKNVNLPQIFYKYIFTKHLQPCLFWSKNTKKNIHENPKKIPDGSILSSIRCFRTPSWCFSIQVEILPFPETNPARIQTPENKHFGPEKERQSSSNHWNLRSG